MQTRHLGVLFLLLLAAALPAAADADALPDPGLSFFSAGECLGEVRLDDGSSLSVYRYAFEKNASTFLSTTVWGYQAKVKDAGFSWERLEEEGDDEWYAISRDGLTAWLCLSGSYFSTQCEAVLYVPEGMAFTPEEEVSGRSDFQNDIFVSADDLDTPSAGSSRVTCVSCRGSRRCPVCGGDGIWTNPYTGERNECSGAARVGGVIAGQGYWGE